MKFSYLVSLSDTSFQCSDFSALSVEAGQSLSLLFHPSYTNGTLVSTFLPDLVFEWQSTLLAYSVDNIPPLNSFSTGQLLYVENGIWTASWMNTFAGQYQLRILETTSNTTMGTSCIVQVNASSAAQVQYDDTSLAAQAGSWTYLNVIIRDSYFNAKSLNIPNAQIHMNASYDRSTVAPGLSSNSNLLRSNTQVAIQSYNQSDRFLFSFTANITGTILWSLSAYGLTILDERRVFVASDRIEPTASYVDWTFFQAPRTTGETQQIMRIDARDRYGNRVPAEPATTTPFILSLKHVETGEIMQWNAATLIDPRFIGYQTLPFGPIPVVGSYNVSVTRQGQQVVGSPLSTLFHVTVDSLDAAGSRFLPPSSLSFNDAYWTDTLYTFQCQGGDQFGNNRHDAQGQELLDIVVIASLTGNTADAQIIYLADGVFGFQVRFKESGPHVFHVTIFDMPVISSGVTVHVYAPVYAPATRLQGSGLTQCTVGKTCGFYLQLVDAFQHNYPFPDASLSATLNDNPCVISYLDQGQYQISFEPHQSGTASLEIRLGDNLVPLPSNQPLVIQMNDTMIACLTGAIVLGLFLFFFSTYLIRQHLLEKQKAIEQQKMKQAIYKDYQDASTKVQGLNLVKSAQWESEETVRVQGSHDTLKREQDEEQDWEDQEEEPPLRTQPSIKDWKSMQQWFDTNPL